ncbi:hypothetical protein GCM10025857_17590 [Alicyclobacillus contaminans]|nr:hypothetical protein GCM10025857_17590 [Alicyclobacillus contaminans]
MSEWISAYVDGELREAERVMVREHLHHCESCRELAKMFESLSARIESTFMDLSAPPAVEAAIMQQLGWGRQATQGLRLIWVVVCSAALMMALAVGGGLAMGVGGCWRLFRILSHMLRGANLLVIRTVFGQGWLGLAAMLLGMGMVVICVVAIGRVLRQPLDSRLSSP